MSLILDALNKADRERDPRDTVPDLNTVHGGIRAPVNPHRLLWLAGGLALLVVILGMLLLVLWLRNTPPAAPDAAVVKSADPQPAAIEPVKSNRAVMPPREGGESAVPPEVKALYEAQTDPIVRRVVEPEIRPAQVPAPAAAQQTSVDEALAKVLWEESRRQPPPAVPQAAAKPVEEKPKVQKPTPLDPDLPVEETMAGHAGKPFLHELPITVQDTIPTLMYAKHDYDSGQVVINKTELRMGDATGEGVLVERVLADGVLLSFNGSEFKLASLSSWVNY